MKVIVKGKKVDTTQTKMEMTRAHIDEDGKVWSKGTVYQPLSAGDGYQEIGIDGEHVFFRRDSV